MREEEEEGEEDEGLNDKASFKTSAQIVPGLLADKAVLSGKCQLWG